MTHELLLVTRTSNAERSAAAFYDPSNGSTVHTYKNGAGVGPGSTAIVRGAYVTAAERGRPVVDVWPVNSQDPLGNVRTVLPACATSLDVSPRGEYMAVGVGTASYLWQLRTGRLLSTRRVHYQDVTRVKFGGDGAFLIVAGEDGMVATYDVAELVGGKGDEVEPLYKRLDHSLAVTDVFVGSFGFRSRFATVSSDQTARLYQLIDGQLLLTLVLSKPLTAVVCDSPCLNLYVGDALGGIAGYSLSNPPRALTHHVEPSAELTFVGHSAKIEALDLNLTNDRLASASKDGSVIIWEVESRQTLKRIELKSAPTGVHFTLISSTAFESGYKPTFDFAGLERTTIEDVDSIITVTSQAKDVKEPRIEERDNAGSMQEAARCLVQRLARNLITFDYK